MLEDAEIHLKDLDVFGWCRERQPGRLQRTTPDHQVKLASQFVFSIVLALKEVVYLICDLMIAAKKTEFVAWLILVHHEAEALVLNTVVLLEARLFWARCFVSHGFLVDDIAHLAGKAEE